MSYAQRRYDRGGRDNYYNNYNNNNNYGNYGNSFNGQGNRSNFNRRNGHDQSRGYSNNNNNDNDSIITCEFYNKIGACRHGEKCSKKHIKPTSSKTLLLANLYQNPKHNKNETEEFTEKQIQEQFDLFFQDIFIHISKMSQVHDLVVCENENNHLNGNVYVQFASVQDASSVNTSLNQEWFNGRPVHCDLSPVSEFSDACCRAYDMQSCERGEMCNYMHIRYPSPELRSLLFRAQDKMYSSVQLERLKKQLDEVKILGDANLGTSGAGDDEDNDDDEDGDDYGEGSMNKPNASQLLSSLH
ncbi:hypothetical protein KGF57_003838 [Candida theae]|uniref:Splicing factor U2AF 23 kDa subunit n=1 Tax=Candida theae TaxID=1198502 RepID=A0AAD5BCG1_9ASCO|nr:uncharacterized protein KGF57_003838 [Candida theae]KAI5954814.1 hypothetical protein KGF57_003838 [Candida theae]